MTDLAIQPRDSLLTLAALAEGEGRGLRAGVWAVCYCGNFVRVRLFAWRGGQYRPRSCARCVRVKCKGGRSKGRFRRSEPFGSGFRRVG